MTALNIVKELTYLDKVFSNTDDYFAFMYDELRAKGYVEATFLEAVKKREKIFPTGLPIPDNPVAIPHCDEDNIKKSFISICRLKSPIKFVEMGTEDSHLEVKIIFMLGLRAHDGEQVELLQQLIASFMDEHYMTGLIEAKDETELLELVLHHTANEVKS
ncbi:PTS sugar transporter subunit IIA [Bacilli bacterium]|nr:PTS sugar transporter subunit IIA [Bacilli bacterium]